jgi:hypothetical protein
LNEGLPLTEKMALQKGGHMNIQKTSILTRQPSAKHEMASVDLADLAAGDQVLIWTENSFYRFRISDASTGRGWLLRAGQSLETAEATLLGTTDSSDSRLIESNSRLGPGMRAMWVATYGDDLRSVFTSIITRLVLIKAFKQGTCEFHAAIWEDDGGLRSLQIYQD